MQTDEQKTESETKKAQDARTQGAEAEYDSEAQGALENSHPPSAAKAAPLSEEQDK